VAGQESGDAFARPRILITVAAGSLLAFLMGLALQLPAADGDRFWVSDRQRYPLIADNLVEHGAYNADPAYGRRLDRGNPIVPYTLRAPGYPFFLAALFLLGHAGFGMPAYRALGRRRLAFAAVARFLNGLAEWLVILHVPAMLASIAILGLRRSGTVSASSGCLRGSRSRRARARFAS